MIQILLFVFCNPHNILQVVIQVLNNERPDPAVWDALYAQAVNIASQFDIEPRAGAQQNRPNPEVQSTSDYWRVILYYVFTDNLVQELTSRLVKNDDR